MDRDFGHQMASLRHLADGFVLELGGKSLMTIGLLWIAQR
jgi:hypothetical protein